MMAGPSHGRQHHGQSSLRNELQPPDSSAGVPETQLEADKSGSDDDNIEIEIDPEAIALMAKCSIQKLAGSAAASQASTVVPQALLVRPKSATTEQYSPFAKRIGNKTSPKEEALAVVPCVHADITAPPIDSAVRKIHSHDTHISPVPMIKECVVSATPTVLKDSQVHDQRQSLREKSAIVKASRTESTQTKSSKVFTESQATTQPATQAASITKKKRNGTRVKKVKKTLLSRPFQPWPPRPGPPLDQSNTQAATVLSTKLSAHEPKTEAGWSLPPVEDLAVKFQPGGATIPDGPLDFKQALLADMEASSIGAVDGGHRADGHQAMPYIHAEQTEIVAHRHHSDAEAEQLIRIVEPSMVRHNPPVLVPYAVPDQHPHAQQGPVADFQPLKGPPPVFEDTVPPRNKTPKPRSDFKPTRVHHARRLVSQTSADNDTSHLALVDRPPRSGSVQDVSYDASNPSGSVRLTSVPKQTQVTHEAYPRITAANETHQMHPETTALDIALDGFRAACLADQYRLMNQTRLRDNEWDIERSKLQATITTQMETITEQNVQLKHTKKLCADKLELSHKFVSGLQKDHEKLQKSMVAFQEHNKRVLQDQIAEILREKEDLQGTFEVMVESCAKSQKGMSRTMNELQLRYVTTSSKANDLKDRLDERVAMYEGEKNRRVELEQQLLPSIRGIQRHLNESSATLAEKISSLQASMESQAAEDCSHTTTKECLLILQKLSSLPLLTSHDLCKAEAMLRYIHERTEAGFERVAKSSEIKPYSFEEIRQCMRDQIQGLQTEILRHGQVIADDQLTREANQSLMKELETEKRINQQLETQLAALRQSETTLKMHVANLENERAELQTAAQKFDAQPREFKLKIAQLQEQMSGIKDDLCQSNAMIEQFERRHLDQQRHFCKYRTDALKYLAGLEEHSRQIADRVGVKDRECDAFRQDAANLQIQLESEQSKNDQLNVEVTEYSSTIKTLRQEKNDAIEKEGGTRDSLRSAEDSAHDLESVNHKLSSELEEACTALIASKHAEQELTSRCSGLQRQISQLQDASAEQLRQMRHDIDLRSQQAKTYHTTSLDDLNSRLTLSEEARKEMQNSMRQMENTHKQQIKCHEQKFNAKLGSLAAQPQHEQEKLRANHRQEAESCIPETETRIADRVLNDERVEGTVAETEGQLAAAESPTIWTQVPNTQQSEQTGRSSCQHLQPGRTRKEVNCQTSSASVVVASSNRQPHTTKDGSVINEASDSDRRREYSEVQVEHFKEVYESRFGPQVPLQDEETQLSRVDFETEVVPETQKFEYGQDVAAQFEMAESQVIVDDNVNQEEDLTDLSTIPSEDLSEMLMDIEGTPKQQRYTLGHVPSPDGELHTQKQTAHDMASDAHSTNSRGRPKSRANTASRMMPSTAQDTQLQRAHVDDVSRHLPYVRAKRSVRADNHDSPEFTHPNNATPKRTYGQRSARGTDYGLKRKATGNLDENDSSKRLRTSTQALVQRPSSILKSYAPYTPGPTSTTAQSNSNPDPTTMTGRRSGYRKSSTADSQGANLRLSSTRNTRSKSNRYTERFADELDRH